MARGSAQVATWIVARATEANVADNWVGYQAMSPHDASAWAGAVVAPTVKYEDQRAS